MHSAGTHFFAGKAEEAPFSTAKQARVCPLGTDNAAGGKVDPALWVVPEKALLGIGSSFLGMT